MINNKVTLPYSAAAGDSPFDHPIRVVYAIRLAGIRTGCRWRKEGREV